jgi:peroxiredoxin
MGYLIDEQGRTASALAVGAEALLRLAEGVESNPVAEPEAGVGDNAGKLVTRQPVRSRINRSGLVAGTPAPEFRLPRLDGGEASLRDYRGRQVLLIFSDPTCGPCDALAPRLEQINGRVSDLQILVISRGDGEANRTKVREHGLTFPVLLQRHWEISRDYGMFATPIGYLIDDCGVIAAPVAVGAEAIVNLVSPSAVGVGPASKEVLLQQ